MNQTGWEMPPVGWLLFIVVAALLLYLLYKKVERPPLNPEP